MNHEIYLYDNAEVLDFSGPFEVFSTAKRLGAKNWNVFLVSELMEPVVAREGYRVLPHPRPIPVMPKKSIGVSK